MCTQSKKQCLKGCLSSLALIGSSETSIKDHHIYLRRCFRTERGVLQFHTTSWCLNQSQTHKGFLRPIPIQIFGDLKIRYSDVSAGIVLKKKFQKRVTKHKQIFPNIDFFKLFMSPHQNNKVMQFKNKLSFIVLFSQQKRTTKYKYKF